MAVGGVDVCRVDDCEIACVQDEFRVVDGDVHAALTDTNDFHAVVPVAGDEVIGIAVGVKANLDVFSGLDFFVEVFFHRGGGLSNFWG